MKILCDTNIIIWAMSDSTKLSKQAKKIIEQATSIYVSAASLWEVAIKASLGKIQINIQEVLNFLEAMAVEQLPITWQHAYFVQGLPFHHHDPFDRILIAQAICEPLILLTHDDLLSKYSDLVIVV